MITALLLGLIRTAIQGIYLVINTILGFVFTNYTAALSAITSSIPMKIAAGFIDLLVGWTYFTGWITLALIVLPIVRLAKYVIGLITKG